MTARWSGHTSLEARVLDLLAREPTAHFSVLQTADRFRVPAQTVRNTFTRMVKEGTLERVGVLGGGRRPQVLYGAPGTNVGRIGPPAKYTLRAERPPRRASTPHPSLPGTDNGALLASLWR
jgi:hypothetical protein